MHNLEDAKAQKNMDLIQLTQDLEGIVQDISKVREDRIILGTQCKEIRHENEALQTQNASLRDSIHTQEMRVAEASAKIRDQDVSMKALGADIVSAREDSRHLLSQLER